MKKIFLVPFILLLIATLIFIGCSTPAPTSAPAKTSATAPAAKAPSAADQPQSIKIGVMFPLTGPLAQTGPRMVDAVKFAFEQAGNKIGNKNVELIVSDETSTPDGALDRAKKLVQGDQVALIIGPLTSGNKLAVAPFMSQQKVPQINTGTASSKISDYPWVFSPGGSSNHSPSAMAAYAYDKLGIKTVNAMSVDAVEGHDFLTAFKTTFVKRGGQLVQEGYVPVGTSDFSPYFTSLKKADAVAAWFQGSDAVSFLTQYHQFGVDKNMPLMAIYLGSFFQPLILNRLPPEVANSLMGEFTPTQWSPYLDDAISQQFVQAYKSKFNIMPEEVESSACVAAQTAIKGLQASGGDTTSDTLYKALIGLDFNSVEGRIHFDQQTRIAMRNIYIAKIDKRDGKFVTIPVFTYNDVPASGVQ